MSMTSVMHLCGAAARDGGYAISQRVGVQDQPGDPLDDLFELQLRFGPGFAAGACAAACRRSRRLVACVCAAPPSARPLRPSPGVHRTAQEGSWRHPSGWFPHLGPRATYQGSPVAGHGSAFTLAIAPESVKPDETRRVHALCATSSMGWLIHAMVGSFGGCGRRVKRVGFAA